jgi:hypothetical protein
LVISDIVKLYRNSKEKTSSPALPLGAGEGRKKKFQILLIYEICFPSPASRRGVRDDVL